MTLFVDRSVWRLALRRDVDVEEHEVQALTGTLFGGDVVITTSLVPQELLALL